jgi:hypothetical protein
VVCLRCSDALCVCNQHLIVFFLSSSALHRSVLVYFLLRFSSSTELPGVSYGHEEREVDKLSRLMQHSLAQLHTCTNLCEHCNTAVSKTYFSVSADEHWQVSRRDIGWLVEGNLSRGKIKHIP